MRLRPLEATDFEALKVITAGSDMTQVQSFASVASSDNVEGFTVAQWVEYAKKKAKIASVQCRENGRHHDQLAANGIGVLGSDTRSKYDPVFLSDPWATVTMPRVARRLEAQGAWPSWVP